MIFFVEKMREAFALQKLLTFFQQKLLAYFIINGCDFNETLTNDVVSLKNRPKPFLQRGTVFLTSAMETTSLDDSLSKMRFIPKGKNLLLYRSKFFPLRVDYH